MSAHQPIQSPIGKFFAELSFKKATRIPLNQKHGSVASAPQKNKQNKKHTITRVEVNPSFLCTYAYIFIKSSCIHIKQSYAKSPGFQS
ncbi:MAG: hypothetical protein IKI93_04985, partial [Clostridia bacterium]|nr:hypothetical protein [Clostridia bacterium]